MTIDEIKHLEELSNLQFSEEERAKFASEFDSVVAFASQISNAKVENESFIETMKMDELREDKVKESLPQDKVILNAPQSRRGCFVVPKIME